MIQATNAIYVPLLCLVNLPCEAFEFSQVAM
jgi:hypothetical protein